MRQPFEDNGRAMGHVVVDQEIQAIAQAVVEWSCWSQGRGFAVFMTRDEFMRVVDESVSKRFEVLDQRPCERHNGFSGHQSADE